MACVQGKGRIGFVISQRNYASSIVDAFTVWFFDLPVHMLQQRIFFKCPLATGCCS